MHNILVIRNFWRAILKKIYKIVSNLFFCFSVLTVVIMLIHSVIDYQDYLQHPEYSAPFSVNLLVKGVTYSIPIIVGFVLYSIFKGKSNRY